jgi:hypothetical protein
VEELNVFTHFVQIPASSNVSTIRFEAVKLIRVPTEIRYTMDADYCAELVLFREPGGSMRCPKVSTGALTTAYEVTYSYHGPALISDEYGLKYFLFRVYFRPDELASHVRTALSNRKLSRAERASYFTVRTSRDDVKKVVIDEAQSSFCDTTIQDDFWSRTDPNCRDRISYKNITIPSDYITVRVDPIPAH